MELLKKWFGYGRNHNSTDKVVTVEIATKEQLVTSSDYRLMDCLPNDLPQLSFSFNFGDKHA